MADTQQHFRTCHLCEAMCGIIIEHQGEQILSIKGDPDDPLSRGNICPKAVALQDLQSDPDRLRQPMKRVGTEWMPVSWDHAYEEIENRFKAIRSEHSKHSLAVYAGNPTAHSAGAILFLPNLIRAFAGRNRFSATSVDQLPHMLTSYKLFGNQALFTIPDLDRCDHLLIIGANPGASNGSLMSAGDPMGRIKAIRQRGGRVTVIDPRRTETADKADEHVFIRPGSDLYLIAAMLQVIFAERLARPRHLSEMIDGLDALKQAVADFTPEHAADYTGISADTIRRLTRDFAASDHACAYSRCGTSMQQHGQLTTWLVTALNIVTGNLDHEGGMMFTRPAIDLVALSATGRGLQGSFGRFKSRVRELPEFGGELPVAAFAEEILTPGKDQIRGLITHAGNPVLSTPNGRQVEAALATLDCYVAVDYYINETTRHAHFILPPTGPLERPYYDVIFNTLAVRNVAKYSPPLLAKADDARHDWEILLELTLRMSTEPGSERWQARASQKLVQRLGLEGVLDILLRVGPYGQQAAWLQRASSLLSENALTAPLFGQVKTWLQRQVAQRGHLEKAIAGFGPFSGAAQGLSIRTLKQHPHGKDLGALQRAFPQRLFTDSQRIQLSPDDFIAALHAALKTAPTEQLAGPGHALLVIGRRHVRSNNSWMHNAHRLVKGKDRCTVLLHPEDAEALAISDGDSLTLRSRVGEISLPVQVSDSIMPGVASVPHGWGHDRAGTQLSIAEKHAGASLNDLTDDQDVDGVNGVAVLNGFWVRARKVA